MSALVPYNYRGERYSGSHKRNGQQYYYDKRMMGQSLFIPRPFPTQSYHQPYFYPNSGYLPKDRNLFEQATASRALVSLNRSNEQYRYAQYIRQLNTMQKHYSRREASFMPPPPLYTESPWYQTTGPIYHYEKETRYVPYPVFVGPGGRPLGIGGKLGRGYTGGLTTMLAPGSNTMDLPPKIRVIFMPTGSPPFQPPCTGALGMPPFLFNRMAQPLCALPLPPPLPQIASLPITPVVQQMIMQQYARPVAVFPFTPNWQMPPPMMSAYPQPPQYPQLLQALQQPQQAIGSISALEPPQFIPQSYIPPTLLPSNMPLLPSNVASFPTYSNTIPSEASHMNNGYPSTCRACIPPPPSLNVSVTGHCWVQHCSACHHVPADTISPNNRPTNGRFTPLLRHPAVQQNVCCPPMQQQQYPYINTSIATRPWVHNLPPLPPGAVIISDGYVNNNEVASICHFAQNCAIQNPRVFNSAPPPEAFSGCYINQNQRRKHRSDKKRRKKHKDNQSRSKPKSTSITSSSYSSIPTINPTVSSSSSPCSLCESERADKQPEPDIISKENQQSPTEAHDINLRYKYQPPDLHSVYNNNRHLKTSDTDSISNTVISPNSLPIAADNHDALLSPVSVDLMKNEDRKSVKRIIIIRQFRTNSPSTISTVSSNQSFVVFDKDGDSISTTSIRQTYPTNENN